jgi:exodeoxyribonuclease VII small subunit
VGKSGIFIVNEGDMENKNTSFEDALGRLEKIVAQMESGDLKLEDSMKLFEEGSASRGSATTAR